MDEQLKKVLGILLSKINRNELLVVSVAKIVSEHSTVLYDLLGQFQKCETEFCDEPYTVIDTENHKICDSCCAIKIVTMKLDENNFVDLPNASPIRSIILLSSALGNNKLPPKIIH